MIEINNLTKVEVDEKFLIKIVKTIVNEEVGPSFLKSKEDVSIVFVSSQKMKELNTKYRSKRRPTDVLSFSGIDLKEIVICPDEVEKNSKIINVTFEEEVVRVLIHGVLHIFGYDHEKTKTAEKRMKKQEEYYLSGLKLS